MAIFLTYWTNQSKPTIWMKFGMWTANGQKTTLLLPSSSFCRTPAVLLPCSFQAPDQTPAQLLLAFCSALLCSALSSSALLLPCFCLAPALLLACSWPASALLVVVPTSVWQPSSTSVPYDFSRHGENGILWYIIVYTVLLNE